MSTSSPARSRRLSNPVSSAAHHPLLLWAWSLLRLHFVGVAFGALFFCLSLTSSLLPRDWLFQGLIGGVNAGIGYGIGVVMARCSTAWCCAGAAGASRARGCCTVPRP